MRELHTTPHSECQENTVQFYRIQEGLRENPQVKKAMNRDCSVLGKRRLKEDMSLQISKRLLSLEQDKHSIKFKSSFPRTKIMKDWKKSPSEHVACVEVSKQIR